MDWSGLENEKKLVDNILKQKILLISWDAWNTAILIQPRKLAWNLKIDSLEKEIPFWKP